MRPLAVVGNLSVDVVDGGPPRVGGAPYYAARALRALRRPAIVVTKSDARDRARLLQPLATLGVPVRWRAAASTAGFRLDYDRGERTMEVTEVGEPWTVAEATGWVAGALHGCRWLHVAPLARSDFPPETLAALARGRRLLLDGQGLARRPGLGPLVLDADYDPALLRHVAILKLAEDEATAALGGLDEGRLAALCVPEVVVTLGERGSLVWADGTLTHVTIRPAPGRVDPTGAGDAFAAAYVASRAAGQSPPAAARRASALVGALLAGKA